MESTRCTGHCCRNFDLPASLDDWKRTAELEGPVGDEARFVLDMIVPLGPGSRETLSPTDPAFTSQRERYTCRHLQPNGDCGAYDQRPTLCRNYPYGDPCGYAACTWKDHAAQTTNLRGQQLVVLVNAEGEA